MILVLRILLFTAPLTLSTPAHADCPPLGRMPSYTPAGEAETRAYDGVTFSVRKGDDVEEVEVKGRACRQAYAAPQGKDPSSDLEIQTNYREELRKLGAQVLYRDDRTTVAKLIKGAEETWARVYSQETDIEVVTVVRQPLKATLLAPSGPDYRLLGRMPAYEAGTPEKRNFDELKFLVRGDEEVAEVAAQGAKYMVTYALKAGAQASSDVEIQDNYRAALAQLGAVTLYTDPRTTVARLEQGGQTVWVRVYSQESDIEVQAIEEKPFVPPAPQAAALKGALDKEGRAALYLAFDTARAALRPDQAKAIAEVVKLLKENPGLKLSVEGHTDDVGPRATNEKLSRDRAAAVVDALVAAGISRERLKSAGHGPAKPIADNATSEGRARNRRIELVKG
ncbi:MAG TPA: OmpA family protein [Beijerinckiaceae bacterium]|jgi:outer membrane protein OmpA-like peptidoglycan-associated protein